MKTLIAFLCAIFLCTQAYAVPTAEEVTAQWEKNYESIKDFNVAYTETVSDIELKDPNSPLHWHDTLMVDTKVRRDGCYNTRVSISFEGKGLKETKQYIFDGADQYLLLWRNINEGKLPQIVINGGNMYASMKDRDSFKDALLTRTLSATEQSPEETIVHAWLSLKDRKDDGEIRVRPDFETISGVECVVLEFYVYTKPPMEKPPKEGPVVIGWFAHERGMLLMKFLQFNNYDGSVVIDLMVYEVASNNGFWYPRRSVRSDGLSTPFKKCKREIVIGNFVPNPSLPDSLFKYTPPPGALIQDERIGSRYVK